MVHTLQMSGLEWKSALKMGESVAAGKAEIGDSISSIWEIIIMPMVDIFIIDLMQGRIGIKV